MEKYWILLVLFYMAGIIQTGRSQDQCEVKLLTEDSTVFVPIGGHFTVNCSYTCDEPVVKTRLYKSNETNGPNWVSHLVLVDDWEKSDAACIHTDNNGETKLSNITIMAYALPSRVTIDLQSELEEDTAHSITCIAHDVAPVRFLTISVTRGGAEIYSKPYDGDLRMGPTTVTEIYNFTASRSDNLQDFACQATLQLGTVPNTTVQSPSITVRTYALPEDPSIDVNEWIEYGTSATAECRVHNVFPLQNVTLQMSIEDKLLDLETVIVSDSATGSITLANSSYTLGWNKVTCISQLFHLSRTITKDVNIYETPKVNITLSNHTVDLDNMVTVDCIIANRNPEKYCVAISVNGQRKQENCSTDLSYDITASSRHHEIVITCTVYIQENPMISQTATEIIAVHYAPQLSDGLCPTNTILVEGQKTAFPCWTDGNPTPSVHCWSEAWSVPDATFTVTRNMTSQYECEASNAKGTERKTVHITVHYPPVTPSLIPPLNRRINTGESFNLTCQSDALPAPFYTWKIPSEDHVTYSPDNSSITISQALSSHNGIYTCEVMNEHGTSVAHREVVIQGGGLWMWIVIGLVVVIAVVALVVFISMLRINKGKKGFYSMLTGSKNKKSENGLNKPQAPQNTTAV